MDWTPVIRYIEEHVRALNNNVDAKSGATTLNFIVFKYDDFTKEVKRQQNKHKILSATCTFVDDRFGGHYECWIVCKE